MDEKRPSEVFLALWYSRISGQVISREEFFALAETWAEIRRMEAAAAVPSQSAAPTAPPRGEPRTENTPEGVQKVHPDRVEKVHEDEPSQAATPPAPPEGEPSQGVVQNGPDPAKSAAAATGMATRKRKAMEALEQLRASGVGVGKIADADKDLTVVAILDFLDRKPIPLPKLAAIERAVKKLEVGMPSQSGEAGQLPQRGSQSNGEAGA